MLTRPTRLLLWTVPVCATLAFGAVEPGPWFVATTLIAFTTLLWCAGAMRRRGAPAWEWSLASMLLVAALGFGQSIAHASAERYASSHAAWAILTYALWGFVALQILRERSSRLFLTDALILCAVGNALLAFALQYLAPERWLWIWRYHADREYGTFANPDHYAALMAMLLPFAVVRALYAAKAEIKVLHWAFAAIIGAAIVTSRSRGGVIAAGCAVLLLTTVFYIHSRAKVAAALVGIALIGVAGFSVWAAPNIALQKIASLSRPIEQAQPRTLIWKDSLRAVKQHPFIGAGLGTFAEIYPTVQSKPSPLFIEFAHNEYLQALVEGGTVALLLFMFPLIRLFRAAQRVLARRTIDPDALAAAAACLSIAISSSFEFVMHVPAIALFAVMIASLLFAYAEERGEVVFQYA